MTIPTPHPTFIGKCGQPYTITGDTEADALRAVTEWTCECHEDYHDLGVTAIWADDRHHTADECRSEGEGWS